jgi:hypothetical protein
MKRRFAIEALFFRDGAQLGGITLEDRFGTFLGAVFLIGQGARSAE